MNDLVPICSAMLNTLDSPGESPPWSSRIPAPSALIRGVTFAGKVFSRFQDLLQELLSTKDNPSPQLATILLCLKTIRGMSDDRWVSEEAWDWWGTDHDPMRRSSARAAKRLVRK